MIILLEDIEEEEKEAELPIMSELLPQSDINSSEFEVEEAVEDDNEPLAVIYEDEDNDEFGEAPQERQVAIVGFNPVLSPVKESELEVSEISLSFAASVRQNSLILHYLISFRRLRWLDSPLTLFLRRPYQSRQ